MAEEEKALTISFLSSEFQTKIDEFKKEWYQHYKRISKQKTPVYDGAGKQIVKKRPDGRDYIDDAWMSDRLNKHFPGWSWEAAAPLHFLGSEWVVAQGHLIIVDERLLALSVNPPIRKFYGADAVRIQYKQDMPHTPNNIIDVGDSCQSAVTGAKKRAINRLTGIGDDIYGKRVEEEGAGSMEDIIAGETTMSGDNQARMFGKFLSERHIPVSVALRELGMKSLINIKDFREAHQKITEYLEQKA